MFHFEFDSILMQFLTPNPTEWKKDFCEIFNSWWAHHFKSL